VKRPVEASRYANSIINFVVRCDWRAEGTRQRV